MTKVLITQSKLDTLAEVIGGKSNTNVPLTVDEMITAADSITSGGGITPTGNINITSAGVTDVTNYATATVPQASITMTTDSGFYTENGVRKWRYRGLASCYSGDGDTPGFIDDETAIYSPYTTRNAIASGTTITPSTSSQTIGGTNYMMEGAVTVSAMPSGTAGTPTATKGAVNNHAISVTPSVTNTTGYITGSTKTGTAVTVSASELVSGTLSITQNGTADVTNYASVDVSVSGGGGMSISTASTTLNAANASISFTGLQDEPTSFVITTAADLATGASPYKTATVVYDGTNVFGQYITNTNNANVTYATTFSQSYNNGTLTVSGTGSNFQANEYKLVYTYGGSSYNIATSDVQVGSGATSITFTGLTDEPSYFSLAFKSNFGTSSGYQRVITVVYDGNTTYGLAMDSSAKAQTSWTYSYSGGALTITSSGTNNGGYFHQPGYYQLTYAVDSSAPQYETVSKTYRASTSAQSDTIEPSSGYDAMSEVNITIPAVTQTNLSADNIKSGTTVSISNGQSNLWSVTGTYGGGGTSKNTQVVQGTTRTTSSSMTAIGAEMTVSNTGTYDVYWSAFRSNTSSQYTFATQLYVGGTAYGSEQTTWSNHQQNVHLSNVSLTVNQKIRVYGRESRGSSYYMYAGTLTIIEA